MSRTYRDPIHKEINLNSEDPVEALLIELIDSREVQRLRWIKQLGVSWFTFHGAEHSRFPHSLGAMFIAREMLKQVASFIDNSPEVFNMHRAAVMCAALLHDIGHGPFSHSSEKIVEIHHEEWTRRLIESSDTEVNKILSNFSAELPTKVVQVLNKTYPIKFLSNLVSSQLDCDRFDYLLRDSHMTGTSYGNFDLDRVISSISVNQDHDCLVVSGEKGMLAVEDYLYARYSMYLQVYQHKKSLATDALLQKLFKRAKMLTATKHIAFIEPEVYKWLSNPNTLSTDEFMKIDDVNITHHIKHWTQERDVVLKDLAKRFINRKLFKATKMEPESNGDQRESKLKELRLVGLEPEYYLDTAVIANKPYSFYNPNKEDYSKAIFVQKSNGGLQEISEASSIVASLVKGDFENKWLISV